MLCRVCLTVVEVSQDQSWFEVNVSQETLRRTTLRDWGEGTYVNLERALTVGAELGGHLVFGHIDGVCRRGGLCVEGESRLMTFHGEANLMSYVVPRGSVALDGVALTVVAVEKDSFQVNVIPYTLEKTTLGILEEGEGVNFEADMLARYVSRHMEQRQ